MQIRRSFDNLVDKILKEVSIKIAKHEFEEAIRYTSDKVYYRIVRSTNPIFSHHKPRDLTVNEKVKNRVYFFLKEYIPESYLDYGWKKVKEEGSKPVKLNLSHNY